MENKKMKCPVCGCDELQFVNQTVQLKEKNRFFKWWFVFKLFLCTFLFFVGIKLHKVIIEVIGSSTYNNSTPDEIILLLILIFLSIIVLVYPIASVIYTYRTIALIPYKTENKIKYICPCCGKHDDIEKAIQDYGSNPLPKKTNE